MEEHQIAEDIHTQEDLPPPQPQRPRRSCIERTLQNIQKLREWEDMSESSKEFMRIAKRIDREISKDVAKDSKKRRIAVPLWSTSPAMPQQGVIEIEDEENVEDNVEEEVEEEVDNEGEDADTIEQDTNDEDCEGDGGPDTEDSDSDYEEGKEGGGFFKHDNTNDDEDYEEDDDDSSSYEEEESGSGEEEDEEDEEDEEEEEEDKRPPETEYQEEVYTDDLNVSSS